jgi:hypothetical protein
MTYVISGKAVKVLRLKRKPKHGKTNMIVKILFKTETLVILKDDYSCALFEAETGESVLLTHGSKNGSLEHALQAQFADSIVACYCSTHASVSHWQGVPVYSRFFVTGNELSYLEVSNVPFPTSKE